MKKLPYGIADFKAIQTENYYFVDKTKFIPELESAGSHLMFLRPRRFGKSLWIAILEAYYDVYYKSQFDAIFNNTWVLNNRTAAVSSCHILRLDLSAIEVSRAEESFAAYLCRHITAFKDKYELDIVFSNNSPIDMLNDLFVYVQQKEIKLYILIDEYDNFANKLFLQDKKLYKNIVSDKSAFFKQFFTTLKTGTGGNDAPIKRMFITGVTPMTLFDVTSGFNIGKNISLDSTFNEMVGITTDELAEMFSHYGITLDAKHLDLVTEWYDQYRFAETAKNSVYNTDMILYYLDPVIKKGHPPKELIDINVRSDYRKLRHLIYTNHKLNGNFEMLKQLIGGNVVIADALVQDFSAFDLIKEENFKSLLFYQGLVSIKKAGLQLELQIPNETIKRIDIDFLKDSLELEDVFSLKTAKLSELLADFATDGSVKVFEYLADEIKRNTAIRDYIYSEACIKSMYLAYLSLTPYFVIKSEVELNKGFADILLKPLNPYVEYVGMLELKYFARSDKKGKKTGSPTAKQIDLAITEATTQLEKYQDDELVIQFTNKGKILQKVVLVFYGWELIKCVAV